VLISDLKGIAVQKRFSNRFFIFAIELSCTLVVIVLLTMTFAAAEEYENYGHMLADIEIANGGPCDGITAAIAF
jgi:hypothetical protein